MFEKKCPNCGKKINKNFEFCPYCGLELAREAGGLLDEIDEDYEVDGESLSDIESLTREIGKSMGFDFIDRFPFNQIVKNLSKDIEKQFRDIDREIAAKKTKGRGEVTKKDETEIRKTVFPGGFSIQIKMGGAPEMPLEIFPLSKKPMQPAALTQKQPQKLEKELGKLSRLPRKEPETKVRRLTDRIIYEIYLPGVKSIKNVMVNKLENSIEIRAIAKDRAYFKLIPVSLPIKEYYLKDEKLFLELKPEE